MPFLLLFLLSLACLQTDRGAVGHSAGDGGGLTTADLGNRGWPAPPAWLDPIVGALLTWAGICVMWLMAAWVTQRHCRGLAADPGNKSFWMRRSALWRRWHALLLVAFYVFALYFLGWGWTLERSWPGQFFPGLELMLLTPVVAGLLVSWARFYDMDQLAHDVSLYPLEGERFLSRWAYVGLQARHNLLLIVPPLFLIVLQQLIFNVFPGIAESGPWLPVLGVVLLGIAFASIPYLLRWFLGLRPLPAGPIRERLESAARRLDFRFSDILVWDTRRTVANAMVTGILPWMRYIVVTDRLLEALSADEIEGVFGHEVGHVKHHHMFFYMLFMIGSLVALGGVGYLATHLVKEPGVQAWLRGSAPGLLAVVEQVQVYALLPLLLLFAVYLFVVFGYLSRRCERQADIYGCRSVSTQAFVDALEKVAILNGISRENPGWFSCWQHGSIAHRVAFLERMNGDPALEPRFQSRLRLLKWGVVLGLGSVATCVVLTMNHLLRPEDMWRFFQNL